MMLKLVTLKSCFHDRQQNAEQKYVKYYLNKRPAFKPALSALPVHGSIKDWTVSTAQEYINMDQDYIHFTRSSTDDRDDGCARNIRLVRQSTSDDRSASSSSRYVGRSIDTHRVTISKQTTGELTARPIHCAKEAVLSERSKMELAF